VELHGLRQHARAGDTSGMTCAQREHRALTRVCWRVSARATVTVMDKHDRAAAEATNKSL
jgi:hypothetical protein